MHTFDVDALFSTVAKNFWTERQRANATGDKNNIRAKGDGPEKAVSPQRSGDLPALSRKEHEGVSSYKGRPCRVRGRLSSGVFAPDCERGPNRDRRGVSDGTGSPVTSHERVRLPPRFHPARPWLMLGDQTMGSKRKQALRTVHPHCAGIDVGKAVHYVGVPECADERAVRSFSSFTDELHAMAAWLKSCAVQVVAMEATGVYWIPVFEVLDRAGVRGVPGRCPGDQAGQRSQERRARLPVDSRADELRIAPGGLSPVGPDLRAAGLRAPARSHDPGPGAVRAAHAKGDDADERAARYGVE